eukprot:TRINITY_DN44462_c0_g1_i1.p1 TRINITY_DN44462_c0_g1~~TRINITY_DN44462_c0_g1_i1.p1  ORF type:complete len:278 (+),score=105.64 TRINITY_DN44462_c0_g1_i1:49-834(+)
MSRQGSVQSNHTRASQQIYSPTSTQPPPPQQQEDELAGVDWRLTADRVTKKLKETEKKLSQKEDDLKAEKAETRDLRNKVRDLEGMLEAATAAPRAGGECNTCPVLRTQLENGQQEIQVLQQQVRDLEKQVGELKNSVHRGSTSSMQHVSQLQELQKEVVKYKAAHENREILVKQLTEQLEAAHEAILSSAQKGFEYDIKLHQARATLVTMLKKEKGSPRRTSAASSPRQYSPGGAASPTAQAIHHYSPTIRTPASPTSLR